MIQLSFDDMQIRMLDLVLKLSAEGSREPQTARTLLYKLFYDQTDQGMTHFLLNLVKSFNSHKQPKRFYTHLHKFFHLPFLFAILLDSISKFRSFSEFNTVGREILA